MDCMIKPDEVFVGYDCPDSHSGRMLELPKFYISGKSAFICQGHGNWQVEQWPTCFVAERVKSAEDCFPR